jgi:hypothetical protein
VPTETLPDGPVIRGYDFNAGRDLDGLMGALLTSGFQASALGQAVVEANRMVGGGQGGDRELEQCSRGEPRTLGLGS